MCPRISIIDDDASVRRALNRLCHTAGYQVEAWESAEAFLEGARIDETDCLILDFNLPGRTGLQLQTELHQSHAKLPIIFITAFEDENVRQQAIETGAIEYFRKPLDSNRLLDVLQQLLENPEPDSPADEASS